MNRAGGVPRDRAFGAISSIIRARSETVTLTRPTRSKGSLDQTTENTATHDEDMWVFDPAKSVQEVAGGERIQGDLGALALDGVDIQKDDRITYGGHEYEVDTVTGMPSDVAADGSTHQSTSYFTISLIRRATG